MSAVLAILAALVPFVIWLVKRKAAHDELPATRLKRHEDEAREVIADRDVKRVNAILDQRLRAIGRNTRGQGNLLAGGGQDSPSQRLPSSESADAGDSGRAGKP